MERPDILLINPYIYDFAAYDLWLRPLGLLYIAGMVRACGGRPILVDCMDRWDNDVLRLQKRPAPKSKLYDDGYFYKAPVEKPDGFSHVGRPYYRYGMPPEILRNKLESIQIHNKIRLILITSVMIYWYRSAQEVINLCREIFPGVAIVLGGAYATLCRDHARRHSGADYIVTGEGEPFIRDYMRETFSVNIPVAGSDTDETPRPAYDLYERLGHAALLTSRGCPYHCSFCASRTLNRRFYQRQPERVVDEIEYYARGLHIRNMAFYDDALFWNPEQHIKPILRMIIARKFNVNFHTPNGLFPKYIDDELADLMMKSGLKTLRLSFESSDPARQVAMGKVSNTELARALDRLEKAGFRRSHIKVYIMMGLPGQTRREVIDSVMYVHNLGAPISLCAFSPIPGTADWKTAIQQYGFPEDEPLLTNKSVFHVFSPDFSLKDYQTMKDMVRVLNGKLRPSAELNSDTTYVPEDAKAAVC